MNLFTYVTSCKNTCDNRRVHLCMFHKANDIIECNKEQRKSY